MRRINVMSGAACVALSVGAAAACAQWAGVGPDHVTNTNTGSIHVGVLDPSAMPGKLTVIGAGDAGVGVWARGTAAGGSAIYGETGVPGAASVVGHNRWSQGGRAVGVLGMSDAPNGMGLVGAARSPAGTNIGVYGVSASPQGFAGYFDSRVYVKGPAGVGTMPIPEARLSVLGTKVGLVTQTTDATPGGAALLAVANYRPAHAAVFVGDVRAEGQLTVEGGVMTTGAACVRMDHPLDPAKRYLVHYAPESPEPVYFYRGTATLDGAGHATVTLPLYFAAITADPTYTLTPVGAAMPMLHVSSPIRKGGTSFEISGGEPGKWVSWRVEARRSDAEIRRTGAPSEMPKDAAGPAAPMLNTAPAPVAAPLTKSERERN